MVVFLLEHRKHPDADEEPKLIGVFSSHVAAERARDPLFTEPGFRDYPEGFSISEIIVDMIQWSGGFFSGDKVPAGWGV